MLHLDARHTNRSPFVAPRAPLVFWKFPTGGPVVAAPVFAGDLAITASLSGRIFGVTRHGEARWSRDLGARIYGSPLVVGHDVIVGIDGGALVALSTETGAQHWRLALDDDADTAPALLPKGAGITAAAGRTMLAFRADGTVLWRYEAKRKVFASPAVADDGLAVFGSQDDAVYGLEPSGTLRFRIELGADIDSPVAIADNGTLYVGTDGGKVVALRPADGSTLWATNVGGAVRGPISIARDGTVLAPTYGPAPAILALSPDTGEPRWRFGIQGTGAKEFGLHGGPIEDARGRFIFGGQDDALYALAADGTLAWRLLLGGDIDAAVTLADDGIAYVGCDDGNLYAIGDRENAASFSTEPMPSASPTSPQLSASGTSPPAPSQPLPASPEPTPGSPSPSDELAGFARGAIHACPGARLPPKGPGNWW